MSPQTATATHEIRGKTLRIVLACGSFNIGGISTQALTLATEFRNLGHHTIALILDPFGELYESFQDTFDQVVVLRRGWEGRETFLRRVLLVIEKLSPDAILGSAVPSVQAIYPYLDPSIVRITTIHSIAEDELRDGTANDTSTDWVVAVANNIATKLQTRPLACQVAVIPVGVSISAHRRPEIHSTELRLAYVGRLSRAAKNLGQLTAICEALHADGVPFSLTIIGSGEEQTSLMRDFSRTAAAANVNFVGQLTPAEVRQRLLDIDVLLLVSTYESTPHAVLEAMEAGVVPVASRIPGATEDIIEDGVSGFLCDTNDSLQYVAALTNLNTDRQLLRRMSLAARTVIASRFGAPRMARQYLDLIKKTLASNSLSRKKLEEATHIRCCPELRHSCYGFARQVRRRAGDLYRALAHGIRPCCLPTSTGESKFS
jgi:glycosyltransferase involved in cell wall biosynthesis